MPKDILKAALGPAIGAVGVLGGALLGSRSSDKATEAGLEANREALAFTREQEATRRSEYDEAMAEYRRQWDAWNATRTALLQRYGVDIAPPSGPGATGAGMGGPGAGGGPAGAPGPAGPGGPGIPGGPAVAPPGPGIAGPVPEDSLWMKPRQRLTLADMAARRGAVPVRS